MCVRVSLCVCVRAYVRVCVRACVRAYVCMPVCVYLSVCELSTAVSRPLHTLHTHRQTPPGTGGPLTYIHTHSPYLQDTDGLVQHGLGVGVVVGGGQGQLAEVGLQQEVGLGVGRVERVGVHLQR